MFLNEGMPTKALNIPNLITLARVILVPFVVWLIITGRTQAAFYAFAVAGISDAVDGYLAKRFGWQTELGSYLDPLADKLLLVSIFVALGIRGVLPSWFVIAVVSRDVLIVSGVMLAWLMDRPVSMQPHKLSKINTAAAILLAAMVLAADGFGLGLDGVRLLLIWLTTAFTLLSLAAYLRAWLRHMNGYEGDGRPGPTAGPR